jgi:hypothetical protein
MCENRIMKPAGIVLKGSRGQERAIEGEFDQSTLYACMEMSLIYANKIF